MNLDGWWCSLGLNKWVRTDKTQVNERNKLETQGCSQTKIKTTRITIDSVGFMDHIWS